MSNKKIIKNNTESSIQILRRELAPSETYEVPQQYWLELSQDTNILNMINSEEVSISNGTSFFTKDVGYYHIQNIAGIVKKHADITLVPIFSENAPAAISVSPAIIGFEMDIGDVVYGQTRIDNLAGGDVEAELHLCIDNSHTGKWIAFELSYITTTGLLDKALNVIDGTILKQVEVPFFPYYGFKIPFYIPESAFSNGEKYLFLSIKRVPQEDAESPINTPIVLRYCKEYYKKADS